ncbi:MAG: ABC transporter ATP-binding protein [Chloroflexota bacterium]
MKAHPDQTAELAPETRPVDRLRFENVTKRFGDTTALAGVSLAVETGQFVVLLGPSGSGKSTLLRCAAGIEHVSGGGVYMDERVVDDGRRHLPPDRRDLAMVFQDYALWPHMTARQNVSYALRRRKLPGAEADTRARAMLMRVGLGSLTERYPNELSGGEQQRVALARALVASPRLLLFDEPLSNLDAGLRDQMRVEIGMLVREAGATALYITHDQGEAFALADSIGVLERGRLVQFSTPESLYSSPASPFVARLTGLAGELRGEVVGSRSGELASVAVSGGRLAARRLEPLPDGVVRVLVRPSAVQLLPATHQDAHLAGEVRDVAFRGRGYEHVVEISGGHRLEGAFSEHRWERGEHVGVKLDANGCLLFSSNGGAAS